MTEIQKLEEQLADVKNRAATLTEEKMRVLQAESALNKEISLLRAAINKARRLAKPPKISDHALVRYLERAKGIDVQQIRDDMLDERTLTAIATLGDGKYPIGDGCKAIVENHTLVTVVG